MNKDQIIEYIYSKIPASDITIERISNRSNPNEFSKKSIHWAVTIKGGYYV